LGGPVLALDDVSVHDRLLSVEHLSLEVAAGEVVGLAGLEGSGQRTMLRSCAGLVSPHAGRIAIGGKDLAGRPYRDFIDEGVHLLPAGRLEEGLVAGLTIAEHFELVGGNTSFVVDRDAAASTASSLIERFSIKGTPASPAESLSGGNQQRLLLAMMPEHLKLLLMEHPTRGLDIESAEWVWRQLLARRGDGTAIVFASADLDELLRYSDRVAVFFAGRIIKTVDAAATTPEELGFLIGGKEPPS
jgi:simple sugar transport system ATP-binding protein